MGTGWRGGTRKGLDIALGNETVRGGILIRSIFNSEKTVNGPSQLVDAILVASGISPLEPRPVAKLLTTTRPKLWLSEKKNETTATDDDDSDNSILACPRWSHHRQRHRSSCQKRLQAAQLPFVRKLPNGAGKQARGKAEAIFGALRRQLYGQSECICQCRPCNIPSEVLTKVASELETTSAAVSSAVKKYL